MTETQAISIEEYKEYQAYIVKYPRLLEFVKRVHKQSCCNVCECVPCDALDVLREIGEDV